MKIVVWVIITHTTNFTGNLKPANQGQLGYNRGSAVQNIIILDNLFSSFGPHRDLHLKFEAVSLDLQSLPSLFTKDNVDKKSYVTNIFLIEQTCTKTKSWAPKT